MKRTPGQFREDQESKDVDSQIFMKLFVDPTGSPVENAYFLKDHRFEVLFYDEKSLRRAFDRGEFARFGYHRWADIKKIMQPAQLVSAIIRFVKAGNRLIENKAGALDDIYKSPIALTFPRKAFLCLRDGYTYDESDQSHFLQPKPTVISPVNRENINLHQDLKLDAVAVHLAEQSAQGCTDLTDIFYHWAQPPAADFKLPIPDVEQLNFYTMVVPFTPALMMVMFFYNALTPPNFLPTFAQFDIKKYGFLLLNLLEKFRRFLTSSHLLINDPHAFNALSFVCMLSYALALSTSTEIFKHGASPPILLWCGFIVNQFYLNTPHLMAWWTAIKYAKNLISDGRTTVRAGGIKIILAVLIIFMSLIYLSIRRPNLELNAEFDLTVHPFIVFPTYAMPMLNLTQKAVTQGFRMGNLLPFLVEILWKIITVYVIFVSTLQKTDNSWCAFATASLSLLSFNINKVMTKYWREGVLVSENRYRLAASPPIGDNKDVIIELQSTPKKA